jgi:hypothetical protein
MLYWFTAKAYADVIKQAADKESAKISSHLNNRYIYLIITSRALNAGTSNVVGLP